MHIDKDIKSEGQQGTKTLVEEEALGLEGVEMVVEDVGEENKRQGLGRHRVRIHLL
jgi:hypothetical protein